jgi:hypothetical protein
MGRASAPAATPAFELVGGVRGVPLTGQGRRGGARRPGRPRAGAPRRRVRRPSGARRIWKSCTRSGPARHGRSAPPPRLVLLFRRW